METATIATERESLASSQSPTDKNGIPNSTEVENKKRKDPVDNENFVSSMTFASFQRGDLGCCDCDECDLIVSQTKGKSAGEFIPDPVLKAIQEHKRQKLAHCPLVRSQDRSLSKRQGSISVWQWTLPLDSEPLLEFGTSHRFVWVQRLPANRTVKSIGSGIVGSSAEEKARPVMNWKQGGVYFIPSSRGKAIGWVSSTSDGAPPGTNTTISTSANEPSHDKYLKDDSPIVLKIAKIPLEAIQVEQSGESEDRGLSSWTDQLIRLCFKLVGDDAKVSQSSILSEEEAASVKMAMKAE